MDTINQKDCSNLNQWESEEILKLLQTGKLWIVTDDDILKKAILTQDGWRLVPTNMMYYVPFDIADLNGPNHHYRANYPQLSDAILSDMESIKYHYKQYLNDRRHSTSETMSSINGVLSLMATNLSVNMPHDSFLRSIEDEFSYIYDGSSDLSKNLIACRKSSLVDFQG